MKMEEQLIVDYVKFNEMVMEYLIFPSNLNKTNEIRKEIKKMFKQCVVHKPKNFKIDDSIWLMFLTKDVLSHYYGVYMSLMEGTEDDMLWLNALATTKPLE